MPAVAKKAKTVSKKTTAKPKTAAKKTVKASAPKPKTAVKKTVKATKAVKTAKPVAKATKTAKPVVTKPVKTPATKSAKAAKPEVEVLATAPAVAEAPAKKATKRAAKASADGVVKKTKRKAKYIILYSPFLMRETKHELIGEPLESANGRQQWARCAVSHHSQLVNLDALEDAKAKNGAAILLSREDSKEYSPKNEYAIGDVIYHKTWDDVGIIRSKEIMSNGRAALLVHFEKNKEKRLVENLV